MNPPALATSEVVKRFQSLSGRRSHCALAGVSLRVEKGVAFGLIGENGAGKTTFIKLLLSVARPSTGTIRVLGGDPEDIAIRSRIGYLPERLDLPPKGTPLSYLASVARLKRRRVDPAMLAGLIGRVGLEEAAGRTIGVFSKGMRQRLGLAAALLGEPELLILDEPTDGVDPLGRMEIRRILEAELVRGATIFINSHLLSETERVCQRIGILSKGKLLREGPLEELCRVEGRFRLRFAEGANADALTAAGFLAQGSEWIFETEDVAKLNAALDRARSTSALLVDLRKDTRDLESVLAETLGKSGFPT